MTPSGSTPGFSGDLPIPERALAVGAHPDDIEFGAGATLARWAAAGCNVHLLILTDGSKGSWDADEDTAGLVATRRREADDAALALGAAGVLHLGEVDGELVAGREQRAGVTRVIRETRPTVVLGHDPWKRYRLHPDHRHAGFLTLDAVVAARDPHFHPELGLPPHRPSTVLLFEAEDVNHVEDVGGHVDAKIAALLSHRSQWRSTMGIHDRPEEERRAFEARIERDAESAGELAGLALGEAFHRIDGV
jgi:LmbE family N-acetylglucosaminyl deacetylase